jgi:hypothetical protein
MKKLTQEAGFLQCQIETFASDFLSVDFEQRTDLQFYDKWLNLRLVSYLFK